MNIVVKTSVMLLSLTLAGCSSHHKATSQPHIKHEEQTNFYQLKTTSQGNVKTGEYLYRQSDQCEYDALKLLAPLSIKSKNFMVPNIEISAQNLLKTASHNGYDYYKAQEIPSSKKSLAQKLMKKSKEQGIKIKANDGVAQAYAISGNLEYTYDLPKKTQYKKVKILDLAKSTEGDSLQLVAIQDNKIELIQTKSAHTKKISIPSSQKDFLVDEKKIHLLAIQDDEITFCISCPIE